MKLNGSIKNLSEHKYSKATQIQENKSVLPLSLTVTVAIMKKMRKNTHTIKR